MFATGFDLGSENCVIGVARKGGIDVIANEASYRTTPALVTFGDTQRYIGQAAHAQFKRNVPNTVSNIKRLIGRRFDEEDVQKELPYLGYKIKAINDNNDIGIELKESGEVKTFTPVQICASLLGQLKRTAEAHLEQEVNDIVIGVPGWWNDRQRRALLDAAKVAGLHCLQLVNELTACALELGIRKDRLLEKDQSELLCFFDMGDTQTQCSVMRFSKGKLEILGYGFDQHLGGRNFTGAIVEHFRKEWLEKYKIDVGTNPRALLRSKEACQKLKHILSANDHGNVNLECLMNDKDVSGKLKREQFVEMVQPLLERVLGPVERALKSAGVQKEDIVSIEVVGDSHRIPAVGEKLAGFFGKAPSKRTNATEVIAKGAAWQCARASPLFKVMPYELKDLQSYPINFSWKWGSNKPDAPETEGTESLVFAPNSAIPLFKQVTFKKHIEEGMTFSASASYAPGVDLPAGTATQLGSWTINSIPVNPAKAVAGEKSALKIGCKLEESGIVLVSRAEKEWNEENEYEEEQDVPLTEEELKAAEEKAAADAAAAAAAAPAEEEKKEGEEKKEDEEKKKKEAEVAKQPKTKKVKVTKKRTVARSAKLEIHASTPSLSKDAVAKLVEQERAMRAHDQLVIDTAAEKNKVEAYVYETREKVSTNWSDFATDDEKSKLNTLFEATESWLYDEGDDVAKDVYTAKLNEMKVLGDPIQTRAYEAEERGPAIDQLKREIAEWLEWSATTDAAYDHISDADKGAVKAKAESAQQWLDEGLAKQNGLKPTDNPAILSVDIQARAQNLGKESFAIKSKPKPKPKPVEKKEEKKEEAKKEEPAAGAADADAPPPAAEDDKKDDPMDTTS